MVDNKQIYKWRYKYSINNGAQNNGTIENDEPVFPLKDVFYALKEQHDTSDIDILDIKKEGGSLLGSYAD